MTVLLVAGIIGGAIKGIFFGGFLFALLIIVILYMLFKKK